MLTDFFGVRAMQSTLCDSSSGKTDTFHVMFFQGFASSGLDFTAAILNSQQRARALPPTGDSQHAFALDPSIGDVNKATTPKPVLDQRPRSRTCWRHSKGMPRENSFVFFVL